MDDKNNLYQDSYGAGSYEAPKENKIEWESASISDSRRKTSWYVGLVIVAALISGGIYLLTKDYITVGIIMLSVILLAFYGIKKPRKIKYSINGNVLTINDRHYDLSKYKYFTVSDRAKGGSISLVPLRRLSPSITLNFSLDNSDKIISTLGSFMPMEQKENDIFDNLMRYIGF